MTEPVLTADEEARLRVLGVEPGAVERAARVLERVLRGGGKVLLFGNGGSAADAQHMAAELVGRFERDRAALPAVALTTDSSALTALANDFGFERVFARQIEALGRPGDAVLAISTSGSSPNVLEGARTANRLGLATIGLCGRPGSELAALAETAIEVENERTAAVQETHLAVEHVLCRALETLLFERPAEAPEASGRVVELDELLSLREGWRRSGATVVWTNGCFDVLHVGHLRGLEAARALGDVLVVGVNTDDAVTDLKGPDRPLVPAAERAELVASLRPVDYAIVFSGPTPEAILDEVRPDVHTKGAEYAPPNGKPMPEREVVERYGGRIEFLPLVPGRSTSELVERIGRSAR
jgi:rfaE bifunctional protein nucleotidyltransferase chain/domain